jgi:DNA-binding LytR/AlgR family response regulator
MLTIAVCDDDNTDRNKICNEIETYLQNQQISCRIFAYDSAEKLNSVIEGKRLRFDIIFLDIIMDGIDGMTYAHLIRTQDKQVKIIFITCSSDYVYDGYAVGALSYLVKPINPTKIIASLTKAIAQIGEAAKESIFITSGGIAKRILINDILYLESKKNQVEIVFAESCERLTIYARLDDFVRFNPSKKWLRPHKSFIVNFLYVEQYFGDKLILKNAAVIPISRAYRKMVKECFYDLLHSELV